MNLTNTYYITKSLLLLDVSTFLVSVSGVKPLSSTIGALSLEVVSKESSTTNLGQCSST
jgi:hypothetical protein